MLKVNFKKIILNFIIVGVIFLTDRLSKIYILKIAELENTVDVYLTSYLNLYLIWNKGIAFGLLSFDDNFIYNTITSLIVIISRENFGDIDYPVLYFSEHTYGAFSMSTFTLITGLLSNKNYKSAGFFSALLFASHLIIGTWVILLLIFSYTIFSILNKNFNNSEFKKILMGFSKKLGSIYKQIK